MKQIKKITCAFLFIVFIVSTKAQQPYHDTYRPQIHFSPKEHWMNDPNGMVYSNGTWHLFFQYFPGATVWGPMHWGHATSNDLIHWKQQPVALYPDSLGYIFSGSAVVDSKNTSGFGKPGHPALVAIFTHHNPNGEKAGKNDYQNQSLAYSLDEGKTWTKYAGNPVLKNPGVTDFRDPKVMWYEAQKKWVMTLATKDRISFYSSPDLKNWKKESEFGEQAGAHGGVWECPDLFPLPYNGKTVWVLIVNLNPGGPNKGSATQYFLGDFDGTTFTPSGTETKWLDYGPDEYAGVTWGNTGNKRIFLGWMSNWLYANKVPTVKWRNAMTIPRELHLTTVGKEMYLASEPIKDLFKDASQQYVAKNITITKSLDIAALAKKTISFPCLLTLDIKDDSDFNIVLANDLFEGLVIGYNKKQNQYFIDRSKSGNINFDSSFAGTFVAPRLSNSKSMKVSVLLDASSAEVFADGGLSVMTAIFFPTKPYNHIHFESKDIKLQQIQLTTLRPIWK